MFRISHRWKTPGSSSGSGPSYVECEYAEDHDVFCPSCVFQPEQKLLSKITFEFSFNHFMSKTGFCFAGFFPFHLLIKPDSPVIIGPFCFTLLVSLCFHSARFVRGMKFNVQFTYNRHPLKSMHRALETAGNYLEVVRTAALPGKAKVSLTFRVTLLVIE